MSFKEIVFSLLLNRAKCRAVFTAPSKEFNLRFKIQKIPSLAFCGEVPLLPDQSVWQIFPSYILKVFPPEILKNLQIKNWKYICQVQRGHSGQGESYLSFSQNPDLQIRICICSIDVCLYSCLLNIFKSVLWITLQKVTVQYNTKTFASKPFNIVKLQISMLLYKSFRILPPSPSPPLSVQSMASLNSPKWVSGT